MPQGQRKAGRPQGQAPHGTASHQQARTARPHWQTGQTWPRGQTRRAREAMAIRTVPKYDTETDTFIGFVCCLSWRMWRRGMRRACMSGCTRRTLWGRRASSRTPFTVIIDEGKQV